MKEFKNRVFGCVGVKAINSNYNADFQVNLGLFQVEQYTQQTKHLNMQLKII